MSEKRDNIELKTNRLTLRPFNINDSEVVSYNSQRPSVAYACSDMILPDANSVRKWIEWINSKRNILKPLQVLAIEINEEKRRIGLIGVAPKKIINNEIEILFTIADEYQNKGYATEAGKAMIDWAFQNCVLDYLVAIVKLDHIASQCVIKKLGFKHIEQRTIQYDSNPTLFNYYKLNNISD